MSWVNRLTKSEIEEAGKLAGRMSAEELDAESIRYGKLDSLFRWTIVPSSLLPPYAVIFLTQFGLITSHDVAGYAALAGLALMFFIILAAREVWYRWCVVELALLLRRQRDERARSAPQEPASQYAITE